MLIIYDLENKSVTQNKHFGHSHCAAHAQKVHISAVQARTYVCKQNSHLLLDIRVRYRYHAPSIQRFFNFFTLSAMQIINELDWH